MRNLNFAIKDLKRVLAEEQYSSLYPAARRIAAKYNYSEVGHLALIEGYLAGRFETKDSRTFWVEKAIGVALIALSSAIVIGFGLGVLKAIL